MAEHMQIGEVAERTGLSQRTIRYYGEVGLAEPSRRTAGGFRLYTEADVEKLELIKKMKPLDFTLEEMREVIATLAELGRPRGGTQHDHLADRLAGMRAMADERRRRLGAKLDAAESFVALLDTTLGEHRVTDD
ncbi:MerR family transcriptional regulator [Georgenia halophila]|uniref:MerR family transcriptional regulator n=1 Tax=Georgenia halophila TaxID=620889 RepID=A0ABP8LE84_9MICO